MAQEKILGNQLNLTDVATDLGPYIGGGDLVDDLTPQLGGDLDAGGFNVITATKTTASSADNITLQAGAHSYVGGGQYAGQVHLRGGDATNGNTGGYMSMYGGNSVDGYGGWIDIAAGDSTSGYAGWLNLYGGTATAAGGTAGLVTIRGGSGENTDAADVCIRGGTNNFGAYTAGDIKLVPGNSISGIDGNVQVHAPHTNIGTGSLQLWHNTDITHTTGNYVALKAPTFTGSPTADITYILPQLDGSAGDVLQTDGSGNLGFGTAPIRTPIYTISTLPVVVEAGTIYVSDAITGPGSPASTGVQCFGRGLGSPAIWVDVITGLEVV